MSEFDYPTMEPDDIMEILRSLDFATTDDLLTNPRSETIRPVYKNFVLEVGLVSEEELEQPNFSAMGALSNKDLYDEAISGLSFARAIQKLMAAVGAHDFNMKDVHKPEVKRTIRNLSALINFLKFREEKVDRYEELSARSEGLLEQRQNMAAENADLQQQLQELAAKKAEESPQLHDIQIESEGLVKEISALNKQQASLNNEIKELKSESNRCCETLADDRMLLLGAQAECEKLKSQIVRSPEKIKKQLADVSGAVSAEREIVTEKAQRLKDFRLKHDSLCKIEKDINKNMHVMRDLEAQVEKVKSSKRALRERQATIENQGAELRTLSNRDTTAKRQLATAKDRLKKVERDGERALQEAQQRMASKQQDRSELEHTRASNQAQMEQNDEVCREMRENIYKLRKGHEAEIKSMQGLCGKLEAQVSSYHEALECRMRGEF